MRFLVFTLYAPMGSFGEIAVGERRMSWARPGRSAILGLVAAAQGVERADEEAHRRLESGLHYAVRTDAPGRPLIDYHTAQTPKARKGRHFATRREELESEDLSTVLSTREWRTDACFTVVLWPRSEPALDIEQVARALRNPCFVLYMGRKSAPLGLPLNPEIVEAPTFMQAFEIRQPGDEERRVLRRIRSSGERRTVIAVDDDVPEAPEESRGSLRRDLSRRRSAKHDVVMDALRTRPQGERACYRYPAIEEQGLAWLERQGAKARFLVQSGEVNVDAYERHRVFRKGSPRPMTFSTLDFAGLLRVTDSVSFLAAITRGFGASKAYGCGLMLIRRA